MRNGRNVKKTANLDGRHFHMSVISGHVSVGYLVRI